MKASKHGCPERVHHPPGPGRRAGMMPSEMKRLRELEDENGRLKRIVADLSLDKEMLRDIVRVSWWMRCGPGGRHRLRSSRDSTARRRPILGLTLRSFNLWSARTTTS